jgi:hypothetical protein
VLNTTNAEQCVSHLLSGMFPGFSASSSAEPPTPLQHHSDPVLARKVLKEYKADRFPSAFRVLGNLLTEPVDQTSLIERITGCAAENLMVAAFACEAMAAETSPLAVTLHKEMMDVV